MDNSLDPNLKLKITIKKPEATLFEGSVTAVTSYSNKGKFDVLAYHTNFIALIKEEVIIYQDNKKPQIFPIDSGVMKVAGNVIKIILGVETKKPTSKV